MNDSRWIISAWLTQQGGGLDGGLGEGMQRDE
jgi:hypothetical protein